MPLRQNDSHKGSYGKVLTVAGSDYMPGAALLASLAALKSAAGIRFVFCRTCY